MLGKLVWMIEIEGTIAQSIMAVFMCCLILSIEHGLLLRGQHGSQLQPYFGYIIQCSERPSGKLWRR